MGLGEELFGWADVALPGTEQGKHFYTRLFGWEAIDSPAGD